MGLTQIIDTWANADGSLLNALIIITPQPAIVYSETHSVTPAPISYWVQNGVVAFALEANDIGQPAGSAYSVYVNAGCPWTETWTVPTSTAPVALAAVRNAAQSLRRAAFFPSGTTWTLPAAVYGTQSKVPLIILYDANNNPLYGTITRTLSTGDTTVSWANSQAGCAEVLLSPLQYTQAIVSATSVTILASTAGLTNLIGVVVYDSTGLYIAEGVSISFEMVAASPAAAQAAAGLGGVTPFAANFQGAFYSVTISFSIPQTGTIVLLGS